MYYRNGEKSSTTSRPLYRRAQSARETYHPAITDLSEQALRVSNESTDDDGYMYKLTSLDRAGSHDFLNGEISYKQSNLLYTKYSDTQNDAVETPRRQSTSPASTRLPRVHDENSYRHRIIMSAHNRHKLGSLYRRPKSVDSAKVYYSPSPCSIPSGFMTQSDIDNNNYHSPPPLVVTNCSTSMDLAAAEKKKPSGTPRPLGKDTARSGTLLADGTEGQKNGFHQHLVNKHPVIKQKLSNWLTSGFKVQSLRSKVFQGRAATRNGTHDLGTRRKLSEHRLVEDFKKIRLSRLQNDLILHRNQILQQDEYNLTSSLHITNLNREISVVNESENIDMSSE